MKKNVGYRIRKLRESKDYSQENMAGELGITAGAYAKIERGETDPSVNRLEEIAKILEVDIVRFFNDADDPQTGSVTRAEFTELQRQVILLQYELDKLKKD